MTDKTAPVAHTMAALWDLFVELAPDCENFSLPSVNFKNALIAEHHGPGGPILAIPPGKSVEEVANDAGVRIRWAFVKYRDTARYPKYRIPVCQKAWHSDTLKVKYCMWFLCVYIRDVDISTDLWKFLWKSCGNFHRDFHTCGNFCGNFHRISTGISTPNIWNPKF